MTNKQLLKDYEIDSLTKLINNYLNPRQAVSDEWMRRYLAFHSVYYYFEYSVGMVQAQEIALIKQQPDPIICGAAISSYANMGACLKLLDKALANFKHNDTESVKLQYLAKIRRIKMIRNRVSAHPYEEHRSNPEREKFIISKRSGYNSDGAVWIRQVSYDKKLHSRSQQFELTPRIDLEDLRNFLSEVAAMLIKAWS